MATRTNRAGDQTDFTYDNLNRLTAKTPNNYTAPTVTYTYDLAGRLTSVSDNSSSMTSVQPPTGTTGVQYTTTYTYDNLNRRTAVGWDQVDAQGTTASATVTFGHSYNAVNQRNYQTVDDNTWWVYPAAVAGSISYTANAMNQYTAVGSASPTYDSKGNLTNDNTTPFAFTYDAENRMITASGAGNTVAYGWDARGWRKAKTVNSTTTITVTDADNRELLEYDASAGQILRRYVYGNGIDEVLNQVDISDSSGSRPRLTLIPDIQGSMVASLDSTGGALTKTAYKSFGETSTTTGSFRYTGRRIDAETAGQLGALYYYRARMYSPSWGRFLQPDPIGLVGGNNLYAYVHNDPLNLVDPGGMDPGDPFDTRSQAAKDALDFINWWSIKQNREYGGLLVYNPDTKKYYATIPVPGTDQGVQPFASPQPRGTTVVGDYHTHGDYSTADPRTGTAIRTTNPKLDAFNSDNPSQQDINRAFSLSQTYPGFVSYLGTPSQIYKYIEPESLAPTPLNLGPANRRVSANPASFGYSGGNSIGSFGIGGGASGGK